MRKPFDPLQELSHTLQAAFIALEQANDQIQQDRSALLSRMQQLQAGVTTPEIDTDIQPVATDYTTTAPAHIGADDLAKVQELEDQLIDLQRQLAASEARIALAEHEKANLSSDQETELTKARIRADQAESRCQELQADIDIRIDSAEQQANERIEDMRTQMIAELERRESDYQSELSTKEETLSDSQTAYQELELTLSQLQEQVEMWQESSQSLESDLAAANQEMSHQQQQLRAIEQEKSASDAAQQAADASLARLQKQLHASETLNTDQAGEIAALKQETEKLKEWRDKAMRKMYKAGLIKR